MMKKLLISFACMICALGMLTGCQFLTPPGANSSEEAVSSDVNTSSVVDSVVDSSVEADSSEEEDSSVVVTEFCTVVFKQAGEIDISKTVEKGTELTDIPTPVAKTGYDVVWDVTNFSNITENMTVNAVETAKTYTITYDANGGTVDVATQDVVYDSTPTYASPTRAGFRFICWMYNNTAVPTTWTIAEDVTLVASWQEIIPDTCTITFVQAGCENVSKTVEKGTELTDIPTPVAKTGYDVVWDVTDFSNITEDMTVNAVETAKTYKITYDANGGTVDVATQDVVFDSTPTLATPVKENYTFKGWKYEDATVSGKWTIAADVTLVAVWEENTKYTITFVQEGQEDVVKTVYEGTALTDIPTPVAKTGYNVVWSVTDFSNIMSDMTVTAVEKAKTCTITFNLNGGTSDQSLTMTVTYGETYTFFKPTLVDKNFSGWKYGDTQVAITGTWNLDVEGDIELVAQWTSEWTGNY